MKTGSIVRYNKTNKEGVICTDVEGKCGSDQVCVVFYGEKDDHIIKIKNLEKIGVEIPKLHPKKCRSCNFALFDAHQCLRRSRLRKLLSNPENGYRNRHRVPVGPYPSCQNEK